MYSSYNQQASAKAREIGARFQNLTPAECQSMIGPVPEYKNTYPERVRIEENVQQSSGPQKVIDVQLDFRNCILYIIYHVSKIYSDLQFKPEPLLTPASLTGYCLSLIYSQALLNDNDNVRTKESQFVRDFNATYNLDDTTTSIRNLIVPPFMTSLLKGLATCKDENKPNLTLVYSLAAFDLELDFGRTPPISLFMTAHNIIASEAANQAPVTLYEKWYGTDLMEAPRNYKVGNYLGIGRAQNLDNWFHQACTSLFNPVTLRSNTVRPTFGRIPYIAQNFTEDQNNVNPYIHLLALDEDNQSTTIRALEDISNSIENTMNATLKLGEIEFDTKGTQLFSHYYQRIQLPTYHVSDIVKIENAKYVQSRTYVQTNGLFNTTYPVPKTTLIDPNDFPEVNKALYLTDGKTYTAENDPDKIEEFSPIHHITDRVRHLSPFETKSEELFFNIIHGKLIEVEEIDSFAVPQPNPSHSVATENSYFLESAIPYLHIKPFGENDHQVFKRSEHTTRMPVVRMSLYDRTIDTLPRYAIGTIYHEDHLLNGFSPITNVPDPARACNSVSFTIMNETDSTTIKTHHRKVFAWSSYRYINDEQDEILPRHSRTYMLLNFRTLYGTNATLVETLNPVTIIPRS